MNSLPSPPSHRFKCLAGRPSFGQFFGSDSICHQNSVSRVRLRLGSPSGQFDKVIGNKHVVCRKGPAIHGGIGFPWERTTLEKRAVAACDMCPFVTLALHKEHHELSAVDEDPKRRHYFITAQFNLLLKAFPKTTTPENKSEAAP